MAIAINTKADRPLILEEIPKTLVVYCSTNKRSEKAEFSCVEERYKIKHLIYTCPCGKEYIISANDCDLRRDFF